MSLKAAGYIRAIMDSGGVGSIYSKLDSMWSGKSHQEDHFIVQILDRSFGSVPADPAQRRVLVQHQMWAAAFRMYKEICTEPRRRDVWAKSRPNTYEATLHHFAILAGHLGFDSEKIKTIRCTSPDHLVAERALAMVRNPQNFYYPDKERCIHRVAEVFSLAVPKFGNPGLRSNDIVIRRQPPRRHGDPYDADHERDKARLFLPQLEKGLRIGEGPVTSTFVQWSVEAMQWELERLQALVAAEQDRVDEKEILVDRAHADLQRTRNMQIEVKESLNNLLKQTSKAEEELDRVTQVERSSRPRLPKHLKVGVSSGILIRAVS